MKTPSTAWQSWIDQIHKWGIGEFTATFLEASEPLNLLAAQILFMGQPLLKGTRAEDDLLALAHMLEDPDETISFAANLREEKSWTS